jgi:ribosomal protein S18 acetylase RimI-like enzyme
MGNHAIKGSRIGISLTVRCCRDLKERRSIMDVEFKPYHETDHADLSEMIFSLYREDPEGEPISEQKIEATVAESVKHPEKVAVYMIKKDYKNIGCAILVTFWSNERGGNILTIDELYIKKNYRDSGTATKFLSFVEHFENIVALQLETTPSNQRAFALYKRLGFTPVQNTHLIKPLSSL